MPSRFSAGGAQKRDGITPDMTTLGKYIGGGLSFGAFGGRTDLMSQFDPRRPHALMHAGTFKNNVTTMSAAGTGLPRVLTPEASTTLNARGDRLRESLAALFRETGAPLRVSGLGSLMAIHPIAPPEDAAKIKQILFFDLLERGIYLAPRGLIALSLPVGDAEIDAAIAAV